MKTSIFLIALLVYTNSIWCQANSSQVYLCQFFVSDQTIKLTDPKMISEELGYNNQPYFESDDTVLYAGTRNGQTDIVRYTVSEDSRQWLTNTKGSEYSPQLIPDQELIAAIRLETSGEQFLAAYTSSGAYASTLVSDPIVGYQVWVNVNEMYSAILVDEGLSLAKHNFSSKSLEVLDTNIGRSLHLQPLGEDGGHLSNNITYVSKKELPNQIIGLNLSDKLSKLIVETLEGSEDFCWTPWGHIIMGQGSKLYVFDPSAEDSWVLLHDMNPYGLTNITRITVSPSGQYISFVAEQSTN